MRSPTLILLAVATMAVASCSGDEDSAGATRTTSVVTVAAGAEPVETAAAQTLPAPLPPPPTSADVPFTVTPSVEQLLISQAKPGASYTVRPEGDLFEPVSVVADDNGFALFRNVSGSVLVAMDEEPEAKVYVEVLSTEDAPDQSFYDDQELAPGFGYITTRDGTQLSANIVLPGPVEDGPYPTVVEYSGYSPSDPGNTTFVQLYSALGYAYVGVNVRGSGCSNGSYGFFEKVQTTDGYDVIEAVAAQPWVQHGHVGMVGISYPGISQLFVAQTQPPHLAAITPLSVLDDSYRSTLYPGGILNTGFAVNWSAERQAEAEPFGQAWTIEMAKTDPVCEANQLQRGQNQDLLGEIKRNPFYDPALADAIAPRTFVDQINVPVFLAGAWQDEQTGGRFPTMLDKFTGTDRLYMTLVNGLHTESLSLGVFPRYVEFLDLYVAKRTPSLAVAGVIAPILAGSVSGLEGLSLPQQDRFTGMSYEEALAAFESEPAVRVLFEEGAADGQPASSPLPRFTAEFETWPASTDQFVAHLSAIGAMTESPTDVASATTTYLADPSAVPETFYSGSSSGIWRADVAYDWQRNPEGTAAVWTGEELADDVVVTGSGWVELYVSADAEDTDLEVTISEIRPDGTEMYVQSGWLRASRRTEGPEDAGRPTHEHLEADATPLSPEEFAKLRVEIFPVAHVFRAGSKVRLTVDAPGGNRGVWAFETISNGEKVSIATGDEYPSKLVLPTVTGVEVPPAYPACGSLRGQPCRPL